VNQYRLIAVAAAFAVGTAGAIGGGGLPVLGLAICGALVPIGPRRIRRLLLIAAACGVLNGSVRGALPLSPGAGRIVTLEATVIDEIRPEPFGSSFVARIPGGMRLRVEASGTAPRIGERLQLHGRLAAFDGPRNEGEPSPRELAAERGIGGELRHARILARAAPDASDPNVWLPLARAWASGEIHRRLEEPQATILAGALWGERGTLPADLRAEFQDTGTMHVLITAGLHLGAVAALTLFLARRCGGGRISASLLTIAVIWGYALLSGAHLPSVRAATMLSFALALHAAGRRALSWNALGAAALAIALVWPRSVVSASFALSFACVSAILFFAEPIARRLRGWGTPDVVAEALALTLATQLGTWPITAATFLVFAPYAPLANALVVPVVGIAIVIGLAALAASGLPPLAQGLCAIDGALVGWIVGVVRGVASLPGAHVVMTPAPPWAIALYGLGMAGVAALLARGRKRAALALGLACAALVLRPPRVPQQGVTIAALDVGQGDAILVQTEGGRSLLVDAGGKLERGALADGSSAAEAIGEQIVVPALIRAGIHRLDILLLTHPHGDHAGGCAPILRTLRVGVILDGGQEYGGHAYRDCIGEAHARGVPVHVVQAGEIYRIDDGVTLRILAPSEPRFTDGPNDVNENSIVAVLDYRCRLCLKPVRALFMGDAGVQSEARLLASGVDLQADILKVGHHGSAYSSSPEFIRAVSPRYALISVGRENVFGHPAASTLATLAAAGAQILRTDRCGEVRIRLEPGVEPVPATQQCAAQRD
jgi:competence protein ComEC